MSPRSLPLGPLGAASLALAALMFTPACRKSEAEGASLGLEQALRDTRASLAALGLPTAPEASQMERPAPLPPPPSSASAPRRQGTQPPAAASVLQGQEPDAVISALGEPALRRREGEAEIWLYQAPDCRLDLVFYPEHARLVLTHAAARAFGARRLTESACMAAISRAPNPPPWTVPKSGGG
ncbi:MAG: hypothetical protein ING09_02110 [Roseomonas sp.]|nr:hypothetical protein [Roseomonas sp.]MCA3294834.1 hypothetical protein [Roseomonas sp.]